MRKWLLVGMSLTVAGCVSAPAPQPAKQDRPIAAVGMTKRILRDDRGGFVLPDGTRVAGDRSGGFTLPNGAYVSPDGAGGLLLPNGTRCASDGAEGYLCP